MKLCLNLVLLLAVLSITKAQGQNNTTSLPSTSIQDLNTPNDQLNLINEQFLTRKAEIINSNANMVLISQAGAHNTGTVTTLARNSEVSLTQNGNNNSMQLDLQATTIDYQAVQDGNNNLLLELNNGSNTELLQRNVTQTGNGQRLVIHGNNALSDRMMIRMNTDGQSLIIRNDN
ncbi:hypothetical protein SAMN04487911_12713 [Arenibacter nanhaiticus]|uniref:Curlin associated repeat-containing protein n=1 Tax=Arenibacter nanhaiticus TaxID=558155 RepID=A0A1M6KQ11_9FLAO|nr:hypothetical protein [Arenibacter nanhaiticus]SHJ60954.1 hypothetical protein SAMN04487911_12713 [Arenibacter nanhaiticus]